MTQEQRIKYERAASIGGRHSGPAGKSRTAPTGGAHRIWSGKRGVKDTTRLSLSGGVPDAD